jgi:hypothetical protein
VLGHGPLPLALGEVTSPRESVLRHVSCRLPRFPPASLGYASPWS